MSGEEIVKEISEINGFGLKDTKAREEIAKIQEQGATKLYRHKIKIEIRTGGNIDNTYTNYKCELLTSNNTPYSVPKTTVDHSQKLYLATIFNNIGFPSGIYAGTYDRHWEEGTSFMSEYGYGVIERNGGVIFAGISSKGVVIHDSTYSIGADGKHVTITDEVTEV